MISAETRHRLGELLGAVAENEKAVEITRQTLAEVPSFSPHHLFGSLDVSTLGLGTSDLMRFLTHMRIYCSSNDAYLMVKQYDSNNDERISFDEFVQISLPAADPGLREIAMRRTGYLSYNVEYAFSKLLEREMQFQRDVELRKTHLKARYDYNSMDLFRILDISGRSWVSRDDIRFFMREMGIPVDEAGLDAIIRRLDHDGDELLSYSEFVEALTPLGFAPAASLPRQSYIGSPKRSSSPLRQSPSRGSPSRGSPTRSPRATPPNRIGGSPYRASVGSPYKSVRTAGSPYRASSGSPTRPLSASFGSPSRHSYLSESSRVYQSRSLGVVAEQELVHVLKNQVGLDREIEQVKQSLDLNPDFNLYDAFSLFDKYDKGYVSTYDMEKGLNDLRVFAAGDEASLLIKHFSKGHSRINFNEFCGMIVSRENEFARIINSRPREGRRAFSLATEAKLQDLLRLHLRAVSMAESFRQRLARQPGFTMSKAFSDLDLDKSGFITQNEFESMLSHHGFPVTQADLQTLMERYDKNGDGRVSYGEFVQETTPQSPKKY